MYTIPAGGAHAPHIQPIYHRFSAILIRSLANSTGGGAGKVGERKWMKICQSSNHTVDCHEIKWNKISNTIYNVKSTEGQETVFAKMMMSSNNHFPGIFLAVDGSAFHTLNAHGGLSIPYFTRSTLFPVGNSLLSGRTAVDGRRRLSATIGCRCFSVAVSGRWRPSAVTGRSCDHFNGDLALPLRFTP